MTVAPDEINEGNAEIEGDKPPFRRTWILGTPVSIISMKQILRLFEEWLTNNHDRSVVLRDVHGVMLARNDIQLQKAHEKADLVAPDGMPLVWVARLAGFGEISRVCGPDLLSAVCTYGISRGWRHYFYGGAPGVAETLEEKLTTKYPGIKIIGTQCPPFRSLTLEEDEIACAAIRAARPHFVWVGLGTPKQEVWMAEHRGKCGGAVLLGIGAAFDIHAGFVSRAPIWMQSFGLEWAYRLAHEPRRLWRRYLKLAPIFLFLALWELITKRTSYPLANR